MNSTIYIAIPICDRTTASLAPPIASLCAHLAQSMPQNEEKQQLLQKAP